VSRNPECGEGEMKCCPPSPGGMEEALATAADIAFNPTESLLAIKTLTYQNLGEANFATILEREQREFSAALARPSFREAVSAFIEKREPDFHKS